MARLITVELTRADGKRIKVNADEVLYYTTKCGCKRVEEGKTSGGTPQDAHPESKVVQIKQEQSIEDLQAE